MAPGPIALYAVLAAVERESKYRAFVLDFFGNVVVATEDDAASAAAAVAVRFLFGVFCGGGNTRSLSDAVAEVVIVSVSLRTTVDNTANADADADGATVATVDMGHAIRPEGEVDPGADAEIEAEIDEDPVAFTSDIGRAIRATGRGGEFG